MLVFSLWASAILLFNMAVIIGARHKYAKAADFSVKIEINTFAEALIVGVVVALCVSGGLYAVILTMDLGLWKAMQMIFIGVASYSLLRMIPTGATQWEVLKVCAALGAALAWQLVESWEVAAVVSLGVALAILINMSRMSLRFAICSSAAVMVYDFYSVFGSKHMMQLVQASPSINMIGAAEITNRSSSMPIMGLGDLILPGLLLVAATNSLGLRAAIGGALGNMVGHLLLMNVAVPGVPLPATIFLVPMTCVGIYAGRQAQKVYA